MKGGAPRSSFPLPLYPPHLLLLSPRRRSQGATVLAHPAVLHSVAMSEEYKPVVQHIESVAGVKPEQVGEIQSEIQQLMLLSDEDYRKEEKKLLRKVGQLLLSSRLRAPDLFYALQIDFTLLPTLFVLLILNYLDRNALASARVQGLEKDLGMKGTDFNIAISVLFAGEAFFAASLTHPDPGCRYILWITC